MANESRLRVAPQESEERMRPVVNHVIDGIITINEVGIGTTFNPAAERLFGIRHECKSTITKLPGTHCAFRHQRRIEKIDCRSKTNE